MFNIIKGHMRTQETIMNTLLVCYDLVMNQSYDSFYDQLEAYDHCWAMDNHCLISTNDSTEKVKDSLLPHISGNDGIMVCTFSGAWSGGNAEARKWLEAKSAVTQ